MSQLPKRKAGAFALWAILIASAITGAALSVYAVDGVVEDKSASAQAEPVKKEFTIIAEDADVEIAPGKVVRTWTFNGTVPGPTLRFTEGDDVTIHFINKTPLAHTMHFHGNHDDKNDGVLPQVLPGQNYTYHFIAEPAGALMYHCHAYPTSLHIRMGMYGAMIVDSKEPMEPAKEYALVLSEFDPDNQDNFVAKYYPVNGYTDQYMGDNALQVKQNQLVRLYVINIGTTIPYSFHLHSTIFKTYPSGLPSNEPLDAQTVEIGPGNAAIIEARWKWPGTYLFHSHGMQEERGNMGEIRVLPDDGKQLQKSESMLDWQYQLQKELQNPAAVAYDSLEGSAPAPAHGGHAAGGNVVKIAQGAWDKNSEKYYEPAEMTVKQGSAVAWANEDGVVHTVTESNGAFDSSIMSAGQQWEHVFEKEGRYDYYCALHPWMTGSIVVEAGP
jgi:plastocyanin